MSAPSPSQDHNYGVQSSETRDPTSSAARATPLVENSSIAGPNPARPAGSHEVTPLAKMSSMEGRVPAQDPTVSTGTTPPMASTSSKERAEASQSAYHRVPAKVRRALTEEVCKRDERDRFSPSAEQLAKDRDAVLFFRVISEGIEKVTLRQTGCRPLGVFLDSADFYIAKPGYSLKQLVTQVSAVLSKKKLTHHFDDASPTLRTPSGLKITFHENATEVMLTSLLSHYQRSNAGLRATFIALRDLLVQTEERTRIGLTAIYDWSVLYPLLIASGQADKLLVNIHEQSPKWADDHKVATIEYALPVTNLPAQKESAIGEMILGFIARYGKYPFATSEIDIRGKAAPPPEQRLQSAPSQKCHMKILNPFPRWLDRKNLAAAVGKFGLAEFQKALRTAENLLFAGRSFSEALNAVGTTRPEEQKAIGSLTTPSPAKKIRTSNVAPKGEKGQNVPSGRIGIITVRARGDKQQQKEISKSSGVPKAKTEANIPDKAQAHKKVQNPEILKSGCETSAKAITSAKAHAQEQSEVKAKPPPEAQEKPEFAPKLPQDLDASRDVGNNKVKRSANQAGESDGAKQGTSKSCSEKTKSSPTEQEAARSIDEPSAKRSKGSDVSTSQSTKSSSIQPEILDIFDSEATPPRCSNDEIIVQEDEAARDMEAMVDAKTARVEIQLLPRSADLLRQMKELIASAGQLSEAAELEADRSRASSRSSATSSSSSSSDDERIEAIVQTRIQQHLKPYIELVETMRKQLEGMSAARQPPLTAEGSHQSQPISAGVSQPQDVPAPPKKKLKPGIGRYVSPQDLEEKTRHPALAQDEPSTSGAPSNVKSTANDQQAARPSTSGQQGSSSSGRKDSGRSKSRSGREQVLFVDCRRSVSRSPPRRRSPSRSQLNRSSRRQREGSILDVDFRPEWEQYAKKRIKVYKNLWCRKTIPPSVDYSNVASKHTRDELRKHPGPFSQHERMLIEHEVEAELEKSMKDNWRRKARRCDITVEDVRQAWDNDEIESREHHRRRRRKERRQSRH